ncbi:MAG: hypothetical protein ACOYPR_16725 [Saprospiraceae bacterium]
MAIIAPLTFADFALKFPPVDMPVTLGAEDHHVFSMTNDPLSIEMVEQFIVPLTPLTDDEYTEYVPCLAIKDTENFVALIWWRAGLLQYSYFLATFTPKGEPIQSKIIAGTQVIDHKILRTVANIDQDLIVWIAEGAADAAADVVGYDATSTRMYSVEIMPNGMLVF